MSSLKGTVVATVVVAKGVPPAILLCHTPFNRDRRVLFFWIALLHLMAAVMGHGGDNGDEPPHPFGGVVPPRRRGAAVNNKMHKLYKANSERPLKIVFDINTNMPIGEVYECFIRETWFDFGLIANHPMTSTYWASLNNRICARYRGCTNIAKNRLIDFAADVEVAMAQVPTGIGSAGNKEFRKKQNALVAEVALHTHHIADSGGETLLIGSQYLRRSWDVDVNAFLQNPIFVTAIGDIIRSFKNQVNNDGEDEDEDEET
ncbi:unnamed protein product [Lactuca saligna]|uniref:Uncharacterized protein n=1 Tax=Lactuca saligna TaxID=75948 RepID=A0AA36EB90_LACSI|nr:unnamed protein product [Lactuca saligna]